MDDLSKLSKHERKKLKRERRKQEKEEEILKRQRGKRNKMLMQVSFVVVALATIGFFFLQSNPTPTYSPDPRGPPLMKITPMRYDFGDVSVAKGVVSTTLDIRNEGKGNLVIKYMKSSCMCTTATIIKDGVEGPVFGMHGGPADWSQTIGPNETAQLKIYYDPKVHWELKGPVTRTITIFSNDPLNSQMTIRIEANQV